SIPAALEHAARSCLRDALDIGDDRAAALHLLAADALITYACEAVSDFAATDEHAVALDQLAVSASPPQLAHLPDANAQVGQAPAGQAPNGDAPDGGDGNAPEGNAPEGNAPEGSAVS